LGVGFIFGKAVVFSGGFAMRGQLSAEMLIILAIMLGIVFIVYTQMSANVKKIGEGSGELADDFVQKTQPHPFDYVCANDKDCQRYDNEWRCDTSDGRCTFS